MLHLYAICWFTTSPLDGAKSGNHFEEAVSKEKI